MRRITTEEAKQYIPCSEDFTSKSIEKAEFFTLTPSPKGDGWIEGMGHRIPLLHFEHIYNKYVN